MRIDQTKEITLAFFKEGDFFGEMLLMNRELKRSATVETLDRPRFLRLA
jgi:CRP/FNR family cyclic AMP-dependent transcriptional regulator